MISSLPPSFEKLIKRASRAQWKYKEAWKRASEEAREC
jgi:hypothetical protein